MNQAFKSRQLSFLVQNIIFTLVVFAIHAYLVSYFADSSAFFFPLWQIYTFHFVITTLLYTVINYKYSNGKKDIFNTFMVSTFLKMEFHWTFLIQWIVA